MCLELVDVREEWGSELGPLGVPLEGVVSTSDGEELVPVLLAGEVPEGSDEVLHYPFPLPTTNFFNFQFFF